MKIFNIASNICKTPQNISFRENLETKSGTKNKIDCKDFYQDNFNNAYNREYEPVKYEKIFSGYVKPMVLPSQRHTKNKSTLRNEELFYDDKDIKFYYGPEKYDIDDVPVREDLWMDFSDVNAKHYHYGIDTNIFPEEIHFNEFVHQPWMTTEKIEELEKEKDYKYHIASKIQKVTKTDPKTINDIFKSATLLTHGEMKINHDLCNLAIELYKNSKQWTKTERDILNKVKIKFFQSNYIGFSEKIYKDTLIAIFCEKTNEEILEYLKKKYTGDIDVRPIFSREEIRKFFL